MNSTQTSAFLPIPAPIPAESVFSDRFRIHAVTGDSMEPTLKARRDYVLLAPVCTYVGEGIYVFSQDVWMDFYRVTPNLDGKGNLRLFRDNKQYQDLIVTREQFEEGVVGFVVAEIKVKNERFLREAMQ
ncbi:S24 family peptidase [Sinorhizobium meliloti]|uniref:S24 family peptidase n=1 Tax=Rhizobium meliloti TaxID=382 RepID=UPI000D1DF909|nr:S24 family peptidase [Sinorhizobium meliloti]RMI21392.1 S24 family peptidase [Sinorhizobium meliloti]